MTPFPKPELQQRMNTLLHDIKQLRHETAVHSGESTGNLDMLEHRIEDQLRELVGLPAVQPSLELPEPAPAVWEPGPGEVVANCLDNSLKRAAQLLRSTGHPGDAIDASRIEYQRAALRRPTPAAAAAQPLNVQPWPPGSSMLQVAVAPHAAAGPYPTAMRPATAEEAAAIASRFGGAAAAAGVPTDAQDVQRVLGYLREGEAEIRSEKRNFVWADTMARASDLIRNLASSPVAPVGAPTEATPRLWLWKNFVGGKPEYWAFDNPYPKNMDNGDPQTLGEPCGYAIVKPSRAGRDDWDEAKVLEAIARARPVGPTTWPTERHVGRRDDMSANGHLRVGLDSDNDVYVVVTDGQRVASVEFCNGGGGGGRSPRTRQALLALMVAMEEENVGTPMLAIPPKRA